MSLCLILIKLTHKAMSTLFVLFVVCGYLALFLFIEGAFVLWNDTRGPEVQRLQQRLLVDGQVFSPAEHGTHCARKRHQTPIPMSPARTRAMAARAPIKSLA